MTKSKPIGVRWSPEVVEKFQKKYGVMSYQKMLDKLFCLALKEPENVKPSQPTKKLSLEERIRLAEEQEKSDRLSGLSD